MELRARFGLIGLAMLVAATSVACGSDGGEADGGADSTPSVTQTGAAPDGSGSTTSTTSDEGEGDGPLVDSVVAASVHEPVALIERPGDDDHLWLAERAGRVRRVTVADDGNTLRFAGDYVLDISDSTSTEAERGLLGMAFSPDGGTLYVSFTDLDGTSTIASYEMSGPEVLADTRKVLFTQEQPYPNHNGGHITFGPDDQLWLGLGDGGSADDPENRAQDPDTYLGKIIRIDPATGDAETVVSGVRNPWRFAFDDDGSLWIGDVGQSNLEEVDHLTADEIEGANLGWSGFEGSEPYLDEEGRRPADAIAPVFEYSHDGGNCSITGGFPYRGEAIPQLAGAYLFADYCAGRLRAITLDADGAFATELDLGIDVEHPVSFAQDAEGEPYVLSQDGDIVRLLPPA